VLVVRAQLRLRRRGMWHRSPEGPQTRFDRTQVDEGTLALNIKDRSIRSNLRSPPCCAGQSVQRIHRFHPEWVVRTLLGAPGDLKDIFYGNVHCTFIEAYSRVAPEVERDNC
jgi:hypothetical protein